MGREGQAKAARASAKREDDKMLKALLSRDREGTRALVEARNHGAKDQKVAAKKDKVLEEVVNSLDVNEPKRSYATNVIRGIGFDPVAMKKASSQKSGNSRKVSNFRSSSQVRS
jgi:minichromosome maintenance protein 10